MKPYRFGLVAALASVVACFGGPVQAQGVPFGGPTYNPPVSPYLNLIRGGASPGLNYYNIVQPQLQFQSEIAGLQQETGVLQGQSAAGPGSTLATGHRVSFGNLSHYYSRRGMAGIGGGGLYGMGGMGMGMGMGGMGMGMAGMGGMGMGSMGMGGMGMGGMGMGGMGMGMGGMGAMPR